MEMGGSRFQWAWAGSALEKGDELAPHALRRDLGKI